MNDGLQKPDYRWLLVVLLYAATIAWGAVEVFTQHTGLLFLFTIFSASTATWWAVVDARRRGHPIPYSLQFLLYLFLPVSLPIYLIWSRGLRGFGWSLLHAIGLGLAMCLGFYGTAFIVYKLAS